MLPGVPSAPGEEVPDPVGTAQWVPLVGHNKGGVRAPLLRERCVSPVLGVG